MEKLIFKIRQANNLEKPEGDYYPFFVEIDGERVRQRAPKELLDIIPYMSILIPCREFEDIEKSNIVAFQFLTKGYPGKTVLSMYEAYVCEIHYKDRKFMLEYNNALGQIIPSFSVLRVENLI